MDQWEAAVKRTLEGNSWRPTPAPPTSPAFTVFIHLPRTARILGHRTAAACGVYVSALFPRYHVAPIVSRSDSQAGVPHWDRRELFGSWSKCEGEGPSWRRPRLAKVHADRVQCSVYRSWSITSSIRVCKGYPGKGRKVHRGDDVECASEGQRQEGGAGGNQGYGFCTIFLRTSALENGSSPPSVTTL